MRILLIAGCLMTGLVSCGPSEPVSSSTAGKVENSTRVAGSKVEITRKGNVVTGKAGPAWTQDELRNNSFGVVCGGQSVGEITFEPKANGTTKFTATCV